MGAAVQVRGDLRARVTRRLPPGSPGVVLTILGSAGEAEAGGFCFFVFVFRIVESKQSQDWTYLFKGPLRRSFNTFFEHLPCARSKGWYKSLNSGYKSLSSWRLQSGK